MKVYIAGDSSYITGSVSAGATICVDGKHQYDRNAAFPTAVFTFFFPFLFVPVQLCIKFSFVEALFAFIRCAGVPNSS